MGMPVDHFLTCLLLMTVERSSTNIEGSVPGHVILGCMRMLSKPGRAASQREEASK